MFKTLVQILFVLQLSWLATFGQVTDEPAYLNFYQTREFKKAEKELRSHLKKAPNDGVAWSYRGLTYLALGRNKEAIKSLEKAIDLVPDNGVFRSNLAFAYYKQNDQRAVRIAREALALDPKVVTPHFIIASNALFYRSWAFAFEEAEKAIEKDPNFREAYLIKAQALISSSAFVFQIVNPQKPKRSYYLKEAVNAFEKFIQLSPNRNDVQANSQLQALRFFSEHYSKVEEKEPEQNKEAETSLPTRVNYQILKKVKATYSPEARSKGIGGTVRLWVELRADGKVGHILVLTPLGFGLDNQAVEAARRTKFIPTTENGTAVSTIVTMEYGFGIF